MGAAVTGDLAANAHIAEAVLQQALDRAGELRHGELHDVGGRMGLLQCWFSHDVAISPAPGWHIIHQSIVTAARGLLFLHSFRPFGWYTHWGSRHSGAIDLDGR